MPIMLKNNREFTDSIIRKPLKRAFRQFPLFLVELEISICNNLVR